MDWDLLSPRVCASCIAYIVLLRTMHQSVICTVEESLSSDWELGSGIWDRGSGIGIRESTPILRWTKPWFSVACEPASLLRCFSAALLLCFSASIRLLTKIPHQHLPVQLLPPPAQKYPFAISPARNPRHVCRHMRTSPNPLTWYRLAIQTCSRLTARCWLRSLLIHWLPAPESMSYLVSNKPSLPLPPSCEPGC